MRRRHILTGLAALATGAAAAPLVCLEATRHGMAVAMGDLPDADEWQAIVADYLRDYHVTPPEEMVRDLSTDLLVLQRVIDADTNQHARRELQRAAGQLCTVMALSLGSAGQTRSARRWWGTARRSADRSGDPQTRAWVRGKESVRGLYEHRSVADLMVLADESLTATGLPVCAGTMSLLAGRAQGSAMLGRVDEARAALYQLDEVHAQLPTAVLDDDGLTGWAEYCLWHTHSYVYTHLGDTRAAYAAQERALALYPPEHFGQAAMVRMHRARCLVLDGFLDDGLAEGASAAESVPDGFRSGPLVELGSGVLASLPAGEQVRPAADELRQRITPGTLV